MSDNTIAQTRGLPRGNHDSDRGSNANGLKISGETCEPSPRTCTLPKLSAIVYCGKSNVITLAIIPASVAGFSVSVSRGGCSTGESDVDAPETAARMKGLDQGSQRHLSP